MVTAKGKPYGTATTTILTAIMKYSISSWIVSTEKSIPNTSSETAQS